MTDTTADRVANELRLSPRAVLTTLALQARMLRADINATRGEADRGDKVDNLHDFVSSSLEDVLPDPTVEWVPDELSGIGKLPDAGQTEAFISAAGTLAETVRDRRAALIILAELMTFSPGGGWGKQEKKARKPELDAAASDLAGLREDDYELMTAEFDSLMKALRRKSVRWGRVTVVAVAGAGLGVMTGGLAAPAIGGALGATMGFSGAAATSAGLAMLGGGSLAVGGFGVAGGSMLLTGMGGVMFAGFAAAGARFSPIAASRAVAAEAIKLDLIARMVLADSPDHDEKLRRVVESLQENINILSDRTKLLVDKIATLKKEKAETDAENNTLKESIKALKAELAEMKSARTTLAVVRDRIPELTAS